MPSLTLSLSTDSVSAPPSPTIHKSLKGGVDGCHDADQPHGQGAHAYRAPNGALRSVCPALNTLANHSYLPHDGRNITFSSIFRSLQAGFGLSPGFALFMAVGTFTLLRRPSLKPFDLHEAGRHNYIEHDAGMVHDDAAPGDEYAPTDVDLALLHKFLAKAHSSDTCDDKVISMDDIIDGRIEREAVCPPLDALHAELARAEFAMVMEIFGKGMGRAVTREDMDIFLRENRLPDGWEPERTLHLWDAMARSKAMRFAMEKVKEARDRGKDAVAEAPGGAVEWFKKTIEYLLGEENKET